MTDTLFLVLHYITDIADSALLSVICIAMFAYLWSSGLRRQAISLALSYAIASVAIGVLKIFFMLCRENLPYFSPSGHMALSVALFGSYARLVTRQLPQSLKLVPILLFILLMAAIGLTRVWLGYHTLGDVLAGVVVGALSVKLAWWGWFRRAQPPLDLKRLALCVLLPLVLLHGAMLPAETRLRQIAAYISHSGHFCEARG